MDNLTIEADLVARYLDRLYEIGRLPEGGVWRGVYSPTWTEARTTIRGWLEEAGLTVREDSVGNLFGRLEGAEASPVILVGSHVDTVYAGGRLDGALGVVGAIVAVRALMRRHPTPTRTFEVFVSAEEEDSRFVCDFWGSRALLGMIHPDEAERYRDADGIVLAEAMRAVGLDPTRIPEAKRADLGVFLELHIEQGPVLDREGLDLGVVEAISGLNRTRVQVRGQADHAGTTPLALRRDALLATAEMVTAVRAIARELGDPARATVGTLTVHPNQPNIVAGAVDFIVDSRHPDRARQLRLLDQVEERCRAIGQAHAVAVETTVLVDQPPTPMDPTLVELVDAAIRQRGWHQRRMVSGAGHDSQVLGRAIPTAMIFVPSRDGRSHSPAEFTAPEQVMRGVQIVADVLEAIEGQRRHGSSG